MLRGAHRVPLRVAVFPPHRTLESHLQGLLGGSQKSGLSTCFQWLGPSDLSLPGVLLVFVT